MTDTSAAEAQAREIATQIVGAVRHVRFSTGRYEMDDGEAVAYVGRKMAEVFQRAEAAEADGVEPRGCPTPGACSCPPWRMDGDGWLPIASAPRDGTRVLVRVESEMTWEESRPAALISGGWTRRASHDRAVSWKPIPAPPADAGEAK